MELDGKLLNEAIPLYVGIGSELSPKFQAKRVEDRFGKVVAASLVVQIEAILADLWLLKPDWQKMNLEEGTDWALREIHKRYPGLDEQALNAIGWTYSFDMR